ncbi:MAG: D-alanyl-D-alanine carboxypeptidase/D-alanyl-D-alanine-endopeptidase [Gemmatimonadaceae bacterium]|nr:D-alanyl-D-alanine carboxypeptidase/D-alanyl-D-alanine-endopeptidase [Gemmatimonadaceae bacterium]
MKIAVPFALLLGGATLVAATRAVADAPKGAPTPTSTVPGASAAAPANWRVPARPIASRAAKSKSVRDLDLDLDYFLTTKVRGGRWGAIVVSLTRGDTLFTRNADELMQPASTLKLFTTGLAFDRFGPNYQLGTDVLRDTTIDRDGTLHGNLYLRGGGDPSLSTRFLGSASSPMDRLAQALAATGLRHVTGDLIADASAFTDQPIPDGWKHRYLSAAYAAPVSALSLNENVVWVAVSPGARSGKVVLEPASTAFTISNQVTIKPGRTGASITIYRRGEGDIAVRGWIGTRATTKRYSLVVDDPPLFAAGALRASLAALGITVDGTLREAVTPPSAIRMASLESPPLAEIVSEMNRESINHVAELLFRDAARATAPDHIGSVEAGETALHTFLTDKVGVPAADVRVSDGSGLSVRDSVTPRAMVSLLAYAHYAPWSSAFHASLPVAGESELLKARMRRTAAQGNLHAKTGTTNTVASLAGYVTAEDGEILAFALIYNGGDRWNARAAMDKTGAALASFSRN